MAAETSAPDSTIEPSFRSNLWLLNALTIFLSAFLLFQVEPLVAKIILPWYGGVAAVWAACLLFFQVVLLLGYLYAQQLTRHLAPGAHVSLHAALLAASLPTLPILPKDSRNLTGRAHL